MLLKLVWVDLESGFSDTLPDDVDATGPWTSKGIRVTLSTSKVLWVGLPGRSLGSGYSAEGR